MGKFNSRQKRARDEKKYYAGKQELLVDIRERYGKFGERVVQAISPYATRTNGMRELMAKLPLPNMAWTDLQLHDVVARFIVNEGVSRFLELISESAATQTRFKQQPAEPTPPAPIIAPEPAQAPETEQSQLVWNDRRTGLERRSGKDRRDSVELIFRNKRYGKDRRSGKDRRKKQMPPPWPK